MRRFKRVIGACLLVGLGTALSGCIVLPYGHPHPGYYHDHDHYRR